MRYSKRYVILTAILLVTFLAKLNTWNDEYADVTAFRGAQLQDEVFYPLKARSINEEGLIQLTVGEETYGVKDGVILGDHMQVMASLSFVQDFFGCSASLYENQKISRGRSAALALCRHADRLRFRSSRFLGFRRQRLVRRTGHHLLQCGR